MTVWYAQLTISTDHYNLHMHTFLSGWSKMNEKTNNLKQVAAGNSRCVLPLTLWQLHMDLDTAQE